MGYRAITCYVYFLAPGRGIFSFADDGCYPEIYKENDQPVSSKKREEKACPAQKDGCKKWSV